MKTTYTFDKKPTTNILEFEAQFPLGTSFHYQGFLNQQEKDEGASRPSYIEDSWVVEYNKQKIAHILRPYAIDANGNWVWCQVNTDLIVTIPQAFLDSAKYPVIVDPTFGYESVGGSLQTFPANQNQTNGPHNAPVNCNITDVVWYTRPTSVGGPYQATFGIYDNETNLSKYADSGGDAYTNTLDWYTQTLDSPYYEAAGTPNRFAINTGGGNYGYYWDTDTSFSHRYRNSTYVHGTLPAGPSSYSTAANRKASCYCIYAAVASGVYLPHKFFHVPFIPGVHRRL